MHPAPAGASLAGGGVGLCVQHHGHIVLGRYTKEDPPLVQPPPIDPTFRTDPSLFA
jgi:hypothetical protein